MPFKEGDFLEIEYTVWDASENTMLSTTEEKVAKDNNIFNEKVKYGPVLVILGTNGAVKGLDREIRTMKDGERKKFTLKPDDAFGPRYDDLVRVMPMSEFRKHDMDPYPGMQVNLDNFTAVVKSVNSGRVVVDANHPYAGKEMTYEVRVIRQLINDKDKAQALAASNGVVPSAINVSADRVEVSFDNKVQKNADYFVGKTSFVASVFANMKGVKKIDVKEEYLRPEEEKK
jgi:FKBP-type peptidyl-prolyl cis-trans isomerase 2